MISIYKSFMKNHFCVLLLGPKPKVTEDAFEDLLGSHQFTGSKSKEPLTIKEMRKEELARETDPETLRVSAPYHNFPIING